MHLSVKAGAAAAVFLAASSLTSQAGAASQNAATYIGTSQLGTTVSTCPDPGSDGIYNEAQVDDGVNAQQCDLIGDPVESQAGNVLVFVPPEGNGVSSYADTASGASFLSVAVQDDGTIESATSALTTDDSDWVYSTDPEVQWSKAGASNACDDTYFKVIQASSGSDVHFALEGYATRWNYKINAGTIPDYLNIDNTRQAVRDGVNDTMNGQTNCDNTTPLPDHLDPNYTGDTDLVTGVPEYAANSCRPADGHNVIGFGPLDSSLLGLTCTYWASNGIVYEADTRINKGDLHWVAQDSSGCSSAYVIQDLMAHESGHWVGLDDLYGPAHANMTMFGGSHQCESKKQTLGRGDRMGLRNQYQ